VGRLNRYGKFAPLSALSQAHTTPCDMPSTSFGLSSIAWLAPQVVVVVELWRIGRWKGAGKP
jgi:hypothetical protein